MTITIMKIVLEMIWYFPTTNKTLQTLKNTVKNKKKNNNNNKKNKNNNMRKNNKRKKMLRKLNRGIAAIW